MSGTVKGYKVFDPDWTCREFQYEVGKIFEEDVKPKCCNRGFHFCTKASDCFNYYGFNPENKVAEVLALGDVDTRSGDTKCCTNKIQIVREISWQELLDIGTPEIATPEIATPEIGTPEIGTPEIATPEIGTFLPLILVVL